MALLNKARYAARLNAFKLGIEGKPTVKDMIRRASTVAGIDAADLNFPDHFEHNSPSELSNFMRDCGILLNGLAMRYYTDPGFRLGAFTNPSKHVRGAALDMTKRGIDALAEMGGKTMTLWMGQDGVDYSFQGDYKKMWDTTIECLCSVADHNTDIDIAIEYKPNEPRAYALIGDIGTTLLAISEANRQNIGVTLDFAHVLYADEIPAHTAHLIARHSRLMGVHLNDGYGKRDDGLMVGSVHPIQTIELFVELAKMNYDGVIYFDTFPDHGGLDPCAEAANNVLTTDRLRLIAERLLHDPVLVAAIQKQDAAASMSLLTQVLYGGK